MAGGVLFAGSLLFFVRQYAAFGSGAWRAAPWSWALGGRPAAIDVLLFTAFALHHSIFARTGVKTWIVRHIPAALERALYVWISSVLFILTCAAWQPVPGVLWDLAWPASLALAPVQLLGVVITLRSARRLDVLELAGVRQAFGGRVAARPALLEDGFYGLVRHPIYLGWLLIVWPIGSMTGTRLVFAATSTLYLLAAIPIEERELRRSLGEPYVAYARRTRWRLVPFVY